MLPYIWSVKLFQCEHSFILSFVLLSFFWESWKWPWMSDAPASTSQVLLLNPEHCASYARIIPREPHLCPCKNCTKWATPVSMQGHPYPWIHVFKRTGLKHQTYYLVLSKEVHKNVFVSVSSPRRDSKYKFLKS